MKVTKRSRRIAEIIHQKVACLLDERRKYAATPIWITVAFVEVSADLSLARIYITVLDQDKCADTVAALNAEAGSLRGRLSSHTQFRYTPRLEFCVDRTLAEGHRMEALLRQIST